jgi:hypothetical protein
MRQNKNFILGMLVIPLALCALGIAFGGTVSTPNTFVAGTPAVAAEVNANFSAHQAAINDNDARIAALEALLPVVQAESSLRIVRGSINADGTIFGGEGFTVSAGDPGIYTIFFDTPFADVPTIVLSHFVDVGWTANNGYSEAGEFDVIMVDPMGNDADGNFEFVAVGN